MQEMPAQQHDAQRTVLQKFVSAKKEEEATLCLLHGQSSNTIFFLAPLLLSSPLTHPKIQN